MRTKDITDCFEIGWLVGFSITIRNIMAWCPCSADMQVPMPGAWRAGGPLRTAAGPLGGLRSGPVPGSTPPTPGGGGKSGGLAWKGVGYISQPFETSYSKQVVPEKQGGMIFEQYSKK